MITRYGRKEGVVRGYIPKKPGRASHYSFVADAQLMANVWLRPGNGYTADNIIAFLQDTQSHLVTQKISLLRADSGFCEQAFLKYLEAQQIPYSISQ